MTSSEFTGKNTAKSDRPLTALNLPIDFLRNIKTGFPGGADWLERLPALLDQAARRWQLVLGEPFLLSYNYVCAATRKDGSAAVLKIGLPYRELTSKVHALRLYKGQGACRLLEADPENGMLLMECLRPGIMLATI
jgi:streptomycin 6-kinase